MITIRQEIKQDYKEVYTVIKEAFDTAEQADGTEQDLVERLRTGDAFIPELSLVAVDAGKIVGHILFTKVTLGTTRSLGLAPLAILPAYQKQGIGTMLLKEGHRIAKELEFQFSVVLGSETYYPRVGYKRASLFGITAPFEVPDKNFMALSLQEDNNVQVNAELQYAKELFI